MTLPCNSCKADVFTVETVSTGERLCCHFCGEPKPKDALPVSRATREHMKRYPYTGLELHRLTNADGLEKPDTRSFP